MSCLHGAQSWRARRLVGSNLARRTWNAQLTARCAGISPSLQSARCSTHTESTVQTGPTLNRCSRCARVSYPNGSDWSLRGTRRLSASSGTGARPASGKPCSTTVSRRTVNRTTAWDHPSATMPQAQARRYPWDLDPLFYRVTIIRPAALQVLQPALALRSVVTWPGVPCHSSSWVNLDQRAA